MQAITKTKCYNLVNAKGNKLRLYSGIVTSRKELLPQDPGIRWSFNGNQIPMPVRSGTWFIGFPEQTMLDWLKRNGWYLESSVNMHTGAVKVHVFILP